MLLRQSSQSFMLRCRDIKLENTLLDSSEKGRNPLIKLCDFGYSINEENSKPKTAVGTPGYTGQ